MADDFFCPLCEPKRHEGNAKICEKHRIEFGALLEEARRGGQPTDDDGYNWIQLIVDRMGGKDLLKDNEEALKSLHAKYADEFAELQRRKA